MPDMNSQSEWNEQQLFAKLFFEITANCRWHQSTQNVTGWKMCLESKISLVLGVVSAKEKDHLFTVREKVNKLHYDSRNKPREKQGELFNLLFYAESEVDTIAHQHMPFLKIKQEIDIGGL